jgi:hypothetical protein
MKKSVQKTIGVLVAIYGALGFAVEMLGLAGALAPDLIQQTVLNPVYSFLSLLSIVQ